MDALSEASATFAVSLLKLLGQDDPSRNVFLSPVSLSSALGLVLLGAKGSTAARIVQALAMNAEEDVHSGFQSLLTQLQRPGAPHSLSVANRLFGIDSCQFCSSFQESCLKFYQAELEQLPFAKDPESSRKRINAWVSTKTEGKIEELLAKNFIDEECKLILINAVYFKGTWKEQFMKSSTKEMPFKVNQKEQRPVQMMFQEAMFPWFHVRELRAQVLELPYKGQELSMVVVLPDKGVDLSTVEKSLTPEKLHTWTSPNCMRRVEVALPRFKLEEEYDMVSVMQRLGVVDAFDLLRVDLSRVLADGGLCLSKFVHKSVVEVNEEGTEVVAASAVEWLPDGACFVKKFHADRPFLFFIRHNRTRSLLFCGRFSSP